MEDVNMSADPENHAKLVYDAGSNHSTADMVSTDGEFDERLPLDDGDIEKAAEQVVDEWSDRLKVGSQVFDEAAENEGMGEVGAMNDELPAGGYEEVVMGYDDTESAELIEEEIVDESYSEEEVIDDDDDMLVDDVVEEVMEEAAQIINEEENEQSSPPESLEQEPTMPHNVSPPNDNQRVDEQQYDDNDESKYLDQPLREGNNEYRNPGESIDTESVTGEQPGRLEAQQSSSTMQDLVDTLVDPGLQPAPKLKSSRQDDEPQGRTEEPESAHETFEEPDTMAPPTKPVPMVKSKKEPQEQDVEPEVVSDVYPSGSDDVSVGDRESDLESGNNAPAPQIRSSKKGDDDSYSSSSDDEDDDGFLLCVLLFACFCLIAIVLAITLPIVLMKRRRNDVPSTSVPTLPPSTSSPTMAPTSIVLSWITTEDDVRGPELSQYGTGIAMDDSFYVVGAPQTNGTGAVFTAMHDLHGKAHWSWMAELYGEDDGDEFGAAVDLVDDYLIVGAPSRMANGTLTEVGHAYVYVFQRTTNMWLKVGPTVKGDEDIFAAGGEFGRAVAIGSGDIPRVVVGSPLYNKALDSLETGRVYTFEVGAKSLKSLDSAPMTGKAANDRFGSSVDMTSAGQRFIVGAPGSREDSAGYIQIYDWKESGWAVDFEVAGEDGENLGTVVISFADTEDVFAVGAPGYQNGRGRIMVYQRLSTNTYVQLGPDIVGEFDDELGRPGSINGGLEDGSIVLVFAALNGDVKTISFDETSKTWLQRALPLKTGYSTINLDYSEEDGLLVSDPEEDRAIIYKPSTVSVSSIDTYEGPPNKPIRYEPPTAFGE